MEFSEIYDAFSPKIYRVCLGYLNDHDKARDLTQETFITVWQQLDNFRNEAGVGTWIYRIATNKCLRQLQNDKKFTHHDFPEHLSEEFPGSDQSDARQAFLRNCIGELPEIDRIIIGLYLEELPQEDIAEIVGLSHANIRVRIHRIKEKIAKKFEAHGQF